MTVQIEPEDCDLAWKVNRIMCEHLPDSEYCEKCEHFKECKMKIDDAADLLHFVLARERAAYRRTIQILVDMLRDMALTSGKEGA